MKCAMATLQPVSVCSAQVRGSRELRDIFRTMLEAGNVLNQGTANGNFRAFSLDNLDLFKTTKAKDRKTSLLSAALVPRSTA